MDFRSIGNMRYAKIYQFFCRYLHFRCASARPSDHFAHYPHTSCAVYTHYMCLFYSHPCSICNHAFRPDGAAGRQVRYFVAYAPGRVREGLGLLALQSSPAVVARGVLCGVRGACWRGALPLLQGVYVVLCVLPLLCGFRGAFLRRCCRRQQPCGSLRRPRRARGIASSP